MIPRHIQAEANNNTHPFRYADEICELYFQTHKYTQAEFKYSETELFLISLSDFFLIQRMHKTATVSELSKN